MEKFDARSVSDKERELLRKQTISLRKKGRSNAEVSSTLGVHPVTTSRWWQRYLREGVSVLTVPKRGRKEGEKRTLTAEQEELLKKTIVDKRPEQVKLPFALWDRQAIIQLVKREFGIVMPIRTIGLYLERWGFTPQRPTRKAYEQRPAEVEKWLQEEYPAVQARAKAEKAEIFWGDESALSTNGNVVRGYAPAGQTPEIRLNARKEHISMISAVSNRGKLRFMFIDKPIDGDLLIDFMKRLVKSSERKVFLILDNLRVHHCKPVKAWLAENADQIEVAYLPAYAPELNPDEYLNSDLKKAVHGNKGGIARSKSDIQKKAVSRLCHLQKTPGKVRNLFKHPKVQYADD